MRTGSVETTVSLRTCLSSGSEQPEVDAGNHTWSLQ